MARLAQSPPGFGDVERLRQLVARRLGLYFEDSRLGFLGEVLYRRLEARGQDAETYLVALDHNPAPDEDGFLAQELTVPETYFFRNMDQFSALATVALPERLRARKASRSLRLLSAGCASGEEAYSLAITARENLPDMSWDVSVRGVDINPAVLDRAERARFTKWALRETPTRQHKWFLQQGSEHVLDETVRDAVRFQQRNLSQDDAELWQPGFYDVIFCRNVIMYFTTEVARGLIARISRSLAPGGYLFLGHAETLRGLSQDFHLRHAHGAFYYQRKDAAESVTSRPARASVEDLRAPRLSTIVESSASWVDVIRQASERIHALARIPDAPPPTASKPDLGGALDLLRRERFSDALDVVDRYPAETARDPDVLILKAALLTHSGELKAARETCECLLAIDALNAGAHYLLALCHEAEGNSRRSGEHDQFAMYLAPTFAMPRLHIGLLARRAGDFEAARRELARARLLLQAEDASRLLLFGGGFGREALIALSAAELNLCGKAA